MVLRNDKEHYTHVKPTEFSWLLTLLWH